MVYRKNDRWNSLKKHIISLKIPVAIYVYNHSVGEKIENIAPVHISAASPVIDTFRKTKFTAGIANFTGGPVNSHIVFRVDGNVADERDVTLVPGTDVLEFDYFFDKAGSHYVSVTVDGDGLQADNTLVKALHVMKQIPVLIIEGISSSNPMKSSAGFAKLTLEASGMPGEDALFAESGCEK